MIALRRSLLGLAALGGFVGCASVEPTTDSTFEIRAGEVGPVDGWSDTDLMLGGNRVSMSPEVAVREDMIEAAERTTDAQGRPAVLVRLDVEGAVALERLSVEQLSRPIVVIVDGRAVSAPIVMSPLSSMFIIAHEGLTEEECDRLVARLEDH